MRCSSHWSTAPSSVPTTTTTNVGKIDAMSGIQPSATALDVEQSTVGDDTTDPARHRRQPVALRRARQNDYTGSSSLDVHSGDVTLDAKDHPAGLPIIPDLSTAQEPAPAVLGKRKAQRNGHTGCKDRRANGKRGQCRFGGSPTGANVGADIEAGPRTYWRRRYHGFHRQVCRRSHLQGT